MKALILVFTFQMIATTALAEDFSIVPSENEIVFKGTFDREAIRRGITSAKSQIQKCKSDKALKFSIEFQIGSDGRAKAGMNNGYPLPDDQSLACVWRVISSINFPKGNLNSTDSVQIPMMVGNPTKPAKQTCQPEDVGKNFESTCMNLNGLHLRALGVAHLQNNFRIVCKCVRDNFDLKKMIPGNSCDFKTEDAFQILKTRSVHVMCVQGRN